MATFDSCPEVASWADVRPCSKDGSKGKWAPVWRALAVDGPRFPEGVVDCKARPYGKESIRIPILEEAWSACRPLA